MKINFIAILILSFTLSTNAQVDSIHVKHRFGLHAGTTSGLGLSYKAEFNDLFQIQLTALPFVSKNDRVFFSGLNLGYKFSDNEKIDYLFLISAASIYTKSTTEEYTFYPSVTTTSFTFHTSAGIGVEYEPVDFFKFNFQLGYGLYDVATIDWRTLPSIGVGFDFLLGKRKK